MRISDQAAQLNITYKPCEDRPDKPPGAVVYRVKENFYHPGWFMGAVKSARLDPAMGARCLSAPLGRARLFRRRWR